MWLKDLNWFPSRVMCTKLNKKNVEVRQNYSLYFKSTSYLVEKVTMRVMEA